MRTRAGLIIPDEIGRLSRPRGPQLERGANQIWWPLFRGSAAAPVTSQAPWKSLSTSLGAGCAIYDGFTDVTTSGGAVTAWADATGTGPTLNNVLGSPSYDSTNGAVSMDGSTTSLYTAASSFFDLNQAYTVAAVMSCAGESGNFFMGISQNGSAIPAFIMQSVSHVYNTDINASNFASTVATGGTIRLVIMWLDHASVSPKVHILIPNQPDAAFSGNITASGANVFTLGGYYQNISNSGKYYGLVFIPGRAPTAGDITALQTYATAKNYVTA